MHTIKLLLTYYSNISVQAANLSDCRIESNRNFFCPNWNTLLLCNLYAGRVGRASNIASLLFDDARAAAVCGHAESPSVADPQFRDAAALS